MNRQLPAPAPPSAPTLPTRREAYGAFDSLGYLHAPAEGADGCRIVEAGPDWGFDPDRFEGASSGIWGRAPSRRIASARLAEFALRREAGILRARLGVPDGLRVWSMERLAPIHRPGALRSRMRFALMSGALLRVGRGPRPARVIDAVACAAGHSSPERLRLRPSGDGSVLARIGTDAGEVELRAARVGSLKDPARSAAALRRLERTGVGLVPRLVAEGEIAGARWTTETALTGVPARRLSDRLARDAIDFCASLPAGPGGVRSLADRLAEIAAAFPRWAGTLDAILAELEPVTRATPGVLQHGDLWIGNLLGSEGRLSGVVDWDTWHPAGMAGADVLHLLGMEERSRMRLEIGEVWLRQPWTREGFLRSTKAYWRRVGVEPRAEVLYAAGVDWWAGQAAAALRRGWRPTRNPNWVSKNIDAVAGAIASRLATG